MMENQNSSSNPISVQNQSGLSELPLDQLGLHIGDTVQLQIGSQRYFVTLIGYLKGQGFIVTLPDENVNFIPPDKGQSVVVRFFSDKLPYAFDTVVSHVAAEPFSHLYLAYPKAMQVLKERQYDRVRVNITGTADLPDRESISCVVHDISIGGALIALHGQTVAVNDLLSLTLRVVVNGVEYELSLDSEIRSVRVADPSNDGGSFILHGLAFNDLSERDILALAAFDLLPDWDGSA